MQNSMMGNVFSVRVKRLQTREEKEDGKSGFIIRPMVCTSTKLNEKKVMIVCGHIFFEPGDVHEDERKYEPTEYREFTPSIKLALEGKADSWSEGYISKILG